MHIMRKVVPLVLFAALAACAAPVEQPVEEPVDQVDLEAERAALLETDREWSAIAAAGEDPELIASYWTDDAKIFPPGAPVIVGKAAILEFLSQTLQMPGFSISWDPDEAAVSASGDFGYTTGPNTMTAEDEEGNLVTTTGRYVTVWRKEPDGSWRCMIDIWNPDAPEGEAGGGS